MFLNICAKKNIFAFSTRSIENKIQKGKPFQHLKYICYMCKWKKDTSPDNENTKNIKINYTSEDELTLKLYRLFLIFLKHQTPI